MFLELETLNIYYEGVQLTLPPHIISVQVKLRSMLYTGQSGRV